MKLNILIIKTNIKVKQFEILKTFSTLSHLQLEVKLLKFNNVFDFKSSSVRGEIIAIEQHSAGMKPWSSTYVLRYFTHGIPHLLAGCISHCQYV